MSLAITLIRSDKEMSKTWKGRPLSCNFRAEGKECEETFFPWILTHTGARQAYNYNSDYFGKHLSYYIQGGVES